ncbi:DNA-primase RepB domain-containing protein [Falsiroseomonas sp. E2-1-a4]|uniref:DNA-primase RepB domain-containing protein n=1 Tax=Falsiroseomonas sp. E2-1-a4 TaxID=3239299 RepID=UPI003F31B525
MPSMIPRADFTLRAVKGWLAALPAARYDVRIVPEGDAGRPELRNPTADGLLRLLPLLKARNAAGAHIYARPADTSYVLVDDIDQDGLEAMRAAGHRPAAVLGTSPWNHQVWLRLAEPGAGPQAVVASQTAKLAAERYDGDRGAASAVQLGRLAGFTNRKARHERADGSFPYVMLLSTCEGVDDEARYLMWVAEGVEEHARQLRQELPRAATVRRQGRLRPCRPEDEYREARRRIEAALPPGMRVDRSRLDHAVARRLLGRGATRDFVRAVLLAGDRAAEMQEAEAQDYVTRTTAAAAGELAREGAADHGGGGNPGKGDEEGGEREERE